MCFSPEADFAAGAVVAGVGVETLRWVRVGRELVVGALPLLFGVHQLVEGFVWLGLRGEVSSGLADAAKEVYIVYPHAVLPAIVPLGFTLIEPDRFRSVDVATGLSRPAVGRLHAMASHRVSRGGAT